LQICSGQIAWEFHIYCFRKTDQGSERVYQHLFCKNVDLDGVAYLNFGSDFNPYTNSVLTAAAETQAAGVAATQTAAAAETQAAAVRQPRRRLQQKHKPQPWRQPKQQPQQQRKLQPWQQRKQRPQQKHKPQPQQQLRRRLH